LSCHYKILAIRLFIGAANATRTQRTATHGYVNGEGSAKAAILVSAGFLREG
jgi:hypothetical protein